MIAGLRGARLGSAYSNGRRDGSQGRRHLQFCRENEHASRALLFVSAATKSVPPPPLTRRSTAFRDPDTRPSTRLFGRVLNRRMTNKEIIMTMFQPISVASDRVLAALVSGLELEFGRGAGEALAQRFLDAEDADYCWDARCEERWIDAYDSIEDDDMELDRVRILGRLDGKWFVAVMIVDGDGNAHGMIGKRTFGRVGEARKAFADA
jgi:hypothetical protein